VLIPREHGAYGQLLFPVVSALLIGRPAAAAYLIAAAGAAAFVAHEPLLVLLGQRGVRAARELRTDAWRSLAIAGGIAVITATAAWFLMFGAARTALILPTLLAAAGGLVVAAGRERSTPGEIVAAVALASLSLPVAIAGDVPPVAAHTVFVVFSVVFTSATLAVRSVIGRTARAGGPHPLLAGLVAVMALVVLGVLALAGRLSGVAPYAALPVCSVALGLAVRPPSPRHLRTIGWTLVGATALTAVLLVSALG
jgi:hypothetical protein